MEGPIARWHDRNTRKDGRGEVLERRGANHELEAVVRERHGGGFAQAKVHRPTLALGVAARDSDGGFTDIETGDLIFAAAGQFDREKAGPRRYFQEAGSVQRHRSQPPGQFLELRQMWVTSPVTPRFPPFPHRSSETPWRR